VARELAALSLVKQLLSVKVAYGYLWSLKKPCSQKIVWIELIAGSNNLFAKSKIKMIAFGSRSCFASGMRICHQSDLIGIYGRKHSQSGEVE
jgi:hypothetical protein